MPLFKGQGCKSTPAKAIAYITKADKAALVSSQSMDDSRSYAEQFRETGRLYGKGESYDERKYYHFKFSCDPADGVTVAQSQFMAEQMAARSFPGHECVIATHTDKAHIHSHIIVNAINFEDGKKLHINDNEYADLKDQANEIAKAHGFTPLDWRKRGQERVSSAEKQIIMSDGISRRKDGSVSRRKDEGISWKDELRDVISEAIRQSDSFIAFQNYLEKSDVTIERNTERTISFRHPDKKKAIRGERLGEAFTKGAIMNGINQQRDGGTRAEERSTTATDSRREIPCTQRAEHGSAGEHFAQREFNQVYSTIRGVEDRAKQLSPTGRAELATREAEEHRTNTRTTEAGKGIEERQRTIERKHTRSDRGSGLER